MDAAIQTRGLVKRFGQTVAVRELDLEVPQGCFYGLLGPNGAGKSTTVGMLTGTLVPSAGDIRILSRRFDQDDPWFKAQTGVVPEEPALFPRLSGREQLLFTGRMFGLGREESARRAADLLRLLRLDGDAVTLVADYSRGMRKKLAIGCALIHAPRLLFFDEPFEGIDALSSETIRRVLQGLTGRGATVLLTTHILEVAEKICDRIGILHRGALVLEEQMQSLRAKDRTLAEVFRQAVGDTEAPEALPAWLIP